MYLNGHFLGLHLCGYTGFTYRIDNISGIKFGAGKQNENVLAAYVDGSRGSGWWYEGAVYTVMCISSRLRVRILIRTAQQQSQVRSRMAQHLPMARLRTLRSTHRRR